MLAAAVGSWWENVIESAHLSAISVSRESRIIFFTGALTTYCRNLSCLCWLSCQNATKHASCYNNVYTMMLFSQELLKLELVCRQMFTLWSFVVCSMHCMTNAKDLTMETDVVWKMCGKIYFTNIKHRTRFSRSVDEPTFLYSEKLSDLQWQMDTSISDEGVQGKLYACVLLDCVDNMNWI